MLPVSYFLHAPTPSAAAEDALRDLMFTHKFMFYQQISQLQNKTFPYGATVKELRFLTALFSRLSSLNAPNPQKVVCRINNTIMNIFKYASAGE